MSGNQDGEVQRSLNFHAKKFLLKFLFLFPEIFETFITDILEEIFDYF